jgi:hypothetical protein
MTASVSPRCVALSAASGALLGFGWFWVVANFSARQGAWWNSLWLIIAVFASGAGLGFASRLGLPWFGRGVLLWVFPILNSLSMLIFVILAT